MRTTCQKPLLLLIPLMLASCAIQNRGFQPVSPPVVYTEPDKVKMADSLQPTLAWKGPASGAESYDLVIYTGVGKGRVQVWGSFVPAFYVSGKEIYYREGINGTSHRMEQALEPNTVYVWAVRTRTRTNTGPWSTYDYQRGLPSIGYGTEGQNLWWRFMTPKK